MIQANDIRDLRPKDEETQQLIAKLARLRRRRDRFYLRRRNRFYLTAGEFDEILRWKLRYQYGRARWLLAFNTDEVVRKVTGAALTIAHEDKHYELELRVGILCALRGVGVPVASAVLALLFPNEYGVIDFRVWRQLFGEDRTTFSIPDYKRYVAKLREIAAELRWPVQEVDHAIWEYDRNHAAHVA